MDLVNRFIHKYSRLPTELDPDYLEMLRMSKYRILVVPDVSPGKCGNCGASKNDGRQYIDFGLHIEWYGALFLCGLCLNDIAKSMGLFNKLDEQLTDFINERDNHNELHEQGVNLHERLVSLFKEFEVYYVGLHSLGNEPVPDISPYVEPESTTKTESESEPDLSEPKTNGQKQRTTKSTSSSGRKDILSLADLLNANDK